MGFFFTLVYLALSLIRPSELFLSLGRYHVMDIAAAIAAGATAASVAGGRHPSFRAPQLYLTGAFIAWAGFSVFAAQRWLGGAVGALQALFTAGFLFFLIALNVDSLPRLQWTRRLLVLLALWLVIQGGAAFFFHYREASFVVHQRSLQDGDTDWQESEAVPLPPESAPPEDAEGGEPSARASGPVVRRIRALGFLNDPNDLAQALGAILPLVFLEWRSRRPLGNLLFVVLPAALILGGIVLTRSRGGFVALGAMAVAAAIHFGNRVVSALAVAASGLGVVAGLAFMRTYVRGDESSFGRVAAWSEGLQMIKSSPLWGVGYRGFTDFHELTAHNSFILCFAELGVVGYFLWLGMIVVTGHDLAVLSRTGPAPHGRPEDASGGELRRWASATGLALVGFLAGAFFLSRSYSETLFIFLALPTALADVARRLGRPVAPFSPLRWALGIGALQVVTLVVIYGMVKLVR